MDASNFPGLLEREREANREGRSSARMLGIAIIIVGVVLTVLGLGAVWLILHLP